jgi:hypothetical protein
VAVAAVMAHDRAVILAGDRGEHLRLMSYPGMSKRPRDPLTPRPFAIPRAIACTEIRALHHC